MKPSTTGDRVSSAKSRNAAKVPLQSVLRMPRL